MPGRLAGGHAVVGGAFRAGRLDRVAVVGAGDSDRRLGDRERPRGRRRGGDRRTTRRADGRDLDLAHRSDSPHRRAADAPGGTGSRRRARGMDLGGDRVDSGHGVVSKPTATRPVGRGRGAGHRLDSRCRTRLRPPADGAGVDHARCRGRILSCRAERVERRGVRRGKPRSRITRDPHRDPCPTGGRRSSARGDHREPSEPRPLLGRPVDLGARPDRPVDPQPTHARRVRTASGGRFGSVGPDGSSRRRADRGRCVGPNRPDARGDLDVASSASTGSVSGRQRRFANHRGPLGPRPCRSRPGVGRRRRDRGDPRSLGPFARDRG